MEYNLLNSINFPCDIKKLDKYRLPKLVEELRHFFLENITKTGGHFASNLGVIELTVAIHYVYNAPNDNIIWDVGHQAYIHKILTGRKDSINTIRQTGGIAPFPKISESEYDAFGVGHSSTSISAALGMAIADKINKNNNLSVAIIGDGAFTAGEAFEAINNAGNIDNLNFLVILNDNEMSISKNVGALNKYLARSVAYGVKDFLKFFKDTSKQVLTQFPQPAFNLARNFEKTIKDVVKNTSESFSLFNNFGFDYYGPIDGHNVITLVDTLNELKYQNNPKLLQVLTKKGYGYYPAILDPIKFHAIKKENLDVKKVEKKYTTYSEIFGKWITNLAAKDKRTIAITPAMAEGSCLVDFSIRYPDRFFDVAIAEQHAVTFAAGLACKNLKPIVAIYSTFLQRAYDQLIHDVALQNLPVLFAIDRAGVVGEDGPTHAGIYDLSFLRSVPNIVIAAPSNALECILLLNACYRLNAPSAVRYPKCNVIAPTLIDDNETIKIGKAKLLKKGKKLAIFAFGSMVDTAVEISNILNFTVIDMRFIKPIDEDIIIDVAKKHEYFITIEENSVIGGAGTAVLEVFSKHNIAKPIILFGIPDIVINHGDRNDILTELGLTKEVIINKIKEKFNFDNT